MKSDYQKEQEAARKRQERREKRAERRIRRALKQEAASLLDKMALAAEPRRRSRTRWRRSETSFWSATGMCVPAKPSSGDIGTGTRSHGRYTWPAAASKSRHRG